jgi:glyoxylase-like metal-dependent hydrolase (beta-lactamase superfamily II)
VPVEIVDVAEGLWLWRQPHPAWEEGNDWDPVVTSVAVRSRGVSLVIDPLAPPPAERAAWERIGAHAPEAAVIVKPDHVRDVDLFVRWYGCRGFGPSLFWPDDVPATALEAIHPGSELPGGLLACHDGRGMQETPLFLPEQRALVFADGMTAPEGVLRVWRTPWHEARVLPAMRELLELPFETVIVSHGDPVHDRAAFEAALEREPWSSWSGA